MSHQPPLANVYTLGAHDVARLRAFYQGLGWPVVHDDGSLVLFGLRGAVLGLFPLEKLAADARAEEEQTRGGIRCSTELLVDARADVDALAARVRAGGGRITKAPVDAEFFDGRSCYFADPEGNYWEIAYAPADNPVVAAARRAVARAGAHTGHDAG